MIIQPPGDAHVLDESGRMSQAWLEYMQKSATPWAIGDYRQSALPSLGKNWLACDGSLFSSTTYPQLQLALSGVTSGGPSTTWRLPNIEPVYDTSHPAPNGPPVLTTYIRAA